jgi:hypothetical protein
MIIPRELGEDGVDQRDIIVSAAVPWNDSFCIKQGTRPLPTGWARLRLIIRPAFDHATLLRALSTDGLAPEITVDDADRAAFSVAVAQPVIAAMPRNPDGTAARYAQFLIAEYASASDNLPLWRGAFIVQPGLLP